jgi:hypothetical protein
MELLSLHGISDESKVALLRALGFDCDGRNVLREGRPLVDPVVGESVTIDNMAILPGSTVVIVDNPLSVAAYLDEHGEDD